MKHRVCLIAVLFLLLVALGQPAVPAAAEVPGDAEQAVGPRLVVFESFLHPD